MFHVEQCHFASPHGRGGTEGDGEGFTWNNCPLTRKRELSQKESLAVSPLLVGEVAPKVTERGFEEIEVA